MSTPLVLFVCLAMITAVSRAEPLFGDTSPPMPIAFSFSVSIIQNIDNPPENPLGHVCGGALIGRRYVLTAASCFDVGRTEDDYFVYAWSKDLASSIKFRIARVITFDNWFAARRGNCAPVRSYAENDIAIIILRRPTYTPVLAVHMWATPLDIFGMAQRNLAVRAIGWERPMPNQLLRHMLGADLQLVDRSECLEQMGIAPNERKNYENLLCTTGVGPRYTVLDAGDKGSPVLAEHEPNNYQLIGINLRSVPMVAGTTQDPKQRNVHISINSYIRFLKTVAKIYYLPIV